MASQLARQGLISALAHQERPSLAQFCGLSEMDLGAELQPSKVQGGWAQGLIIARSGPHSEYELAIFGHICTNSEADSRWCDGPTTRKTQLLCWRRAIRGLP